jgi:phenylpropionate dioxygenase-like ring-hydroxylating dioxygenase large terminal subunit
MGRRRLDLHGTGEREPAPLQKIDVLARTDGEAKLVDGDIRNYNYLNWMENFADMGHSVILHHQVLRDLPEELKTV